MTVSGPLLVYGRRALPFACVVWLALPLVWASGQVGTRSDNNWSISLIPSLQVVAAEDEVSGLRLNLLAGWNEGVDGLDLGLFNGAREGLSGLGLGLIHYSAGRSTGFRAGLFNWTQARVEAFQFGVLNRGGEINGTQFGIVNVAGHLRRRTLTSAFQIGVFNLTSHLDPGGIQVGLLNVAREGARFPVMPLVHARF